MRHHRDIYVNTLQNTYRFQINPSNGNISTLQVLDYEAQQTHSLVVLAIDAGASSRTGTTQVTINVNDLQDSVPVFSDTNIVREVREDATIGTSVAQVVVSVIDQSSWKLFEGTSQQG